MKVTECTLNNGGGLSAVLQTQTNLGSGHSLTATIPPHIGNGAQLEPWRHTPQPWHDPVDGIELLDGLRDIFNRSIILPPLAAEALALFVVQTYTWHANSVVPYLALLSPEKRCGKTTVLSLISELVHRPLAASNVTPAVVFRVIERDGPTLIVDEVDSFLKENEELRGILNAGNTRKLGFVLRSVGDHHEPKRFSVFCPKVFAGIGTLPGTLEDRSIVIRMQRKQRGQTVDRLRHFDGTEFQRRCVRWVQDHASQLAVAEPAMPAALNDRAADLWEPMIAIGDTASERWSQQARLAALAFSGEKADDSLVIQLLSACREYFREHGSGQMFTREVLAWLNGREEDPWKSHNRGEGFNSRQLSQMLKPFGINSRTLRDEGERAKGYCIEDFEESFARYLPTLPLSNP